MAVCAQLRQLRSSRPWLQGCGARGSARLPAVLPLPLLPLLLLLLLLPTILALRSSQILLVRALLSR